MAALTQAIRPDVTLSSRTQGEEIYWRFQDYAPPGAQELGERLARVSGYRLEDTPFASGFAGYKDWFLQDFRRPAIRSRPVSARIRCRFPSSTKFIAATSASSSMRCRNSTA